MIQKEIVLVRVVEDSNTNNKLVGVVARLDIIREKLNEEFITIVLIQQPQPELNLPKSRKRANNNNLAK